MASIGLWKTSTCQSKAFTSLFKPSTGQRKDFPPRKLADKPEQARNMPVKAFHWHRKAKPRHGGSRNSPQKARNKPVHAIDRLVYGFSSLKKHFFERG